jgi:competence ComEA-like helix-hairpin-helix protein
MIAEVSLPPMAELADEIEHFDVSATAWPPAGAGEHVMVLVLASGRPGQFNDVHDLAVYPRHAQFIQPRMSGNAGYRLNGSRVQISVGRVENPRAVANRSGTLSLELWALSAPFAGGRFQGHHLAGVEIGSVNGQSELVLQPIDLAFTPPPPGNWQIVLMLREWTAAGFMTRDYTNFATRFVSPPAVAKAPAPEVPKAAANASAKCVSVNTARVEELAAVNGLSTKLAEGIVKHRPFASLDDLRRVKGLGASIMARVRSSLKL